eukprot:CAMPEP_0170186264 /NCGR_PEP_ID=MMETSP0040_2-20121228/38630_1 /TAXON_ID=641309 /ORGANISM="Lotharella oceanica, Strain CCMP622" /LENGTH=168 /DNA_ID=CAMNT_0010432937 /DNA_START=814 /DNA_END=1320 /DNA_ORIENTATION=+
MPSGALITLTHTRFPCIKTILTRTSFWPGAPMSLTKILPQYRADEAAPSPPSPLSRGVQPLRGPCQWASRVSLVGLSAMPSTLLPSLSRRASVLSWHLVRESEGSRNGKMEEGSFEGKVRLKQKGGTSSVVATGTTQASADTDKLRNEALCLLSQNATSDERHSRTAL